MDINVYSVTGGLAVIGVLVLAARQLTGWPSLKRNNPGGNNKTQMIKDVTETMTRVENLEKGQIILSEKVDKIVEDVSFIRGKMEG